MGFSACHLATPVSMRLTGSIFETKKRRAIPALLYSRFTLLAAEVGILSEPPSPAWCHGSRGGWGGCRSACTALGSWLLYVG